MHRVLLLISESTISPMIKNDAMPFGYCILRVLHTNHQAQSTQNPITSKQHPIMAQNMLDICRVWATMQRIAYKIPLKITGIFDVSCLS